jgi:hypothetical protein
VPDLLREDNKVENVFAVVYVRTLLSSRLEAMVIEIIPTLLSRWFRLDKDADVAWFGYRRYLGMYHLARY